MAAFAWEERVVRTDGARRSISVPLDPEGIEALTPVLEDRLRRFFDDGFVALDHAEGGSCAVAFHGIPREWTLEAVRGYADKILLGVVRDAENGWTVGSELALSFHRHHPGGSPAA